MPGGAGEVAGVPAEGLDDAVPRQLLQAGGESLRSKGKQIGPAVT